MAPPQGHINPPQLHQHHHHHAASNQVSTRPRPSPKTGNKTFNKSPNKKIGSANKHPPDKNSGSTIPALINKPQPLISVVPLIPHGVQPHGVQQQQQQQHHLHQQQQQHHQQPQQQPQHQQQQQQQQQTTSLHSPQPIVEDTTPPKGKGSSINHVEDNFWRFLIPYPPQKFKDETE